MNLIERLQDYLKKNDPEGFGCACQPDGSKCGPCREADRQVLIKAAIVEIERLEAKNLSFKKLLRIVAYPQRGTDEELMDIWSAANLIQAAYTLEELE